MKGLVVYDTTYGNTQKIAETITEALKESGIQTDLFNVKKAKKVRAQDYEFLVLGSPTKFGTMTFSVKFFLGKIKAEDWAKKPFAAFDTENPENLQNNEWSAAEKIADRLKDRQMTQLLPVLKAAVHDWKGPLVEGEIERTKIYARKLAVELKEIKT
jgi:flavodoxin I